VKFAANDSVLSKIRKDLKRVRHIVQQPLPSPPVHQTQTDFHPLIDEIQKLENLILQTEKRFVKDTTEMEARLLESIQNISLKKPRHFPSPHISYQSVNENSCPRRYSQPIGHSSTAIRSPRSVFVEPRKLSQFPEANSVAKRRKKDEKDKSFAEVTSFRKNLMKQMLTMSK
jgi:hypothetical protein